MYCIINFSGTFTGITLICKLSMGESVLYDAESSNQDHGMFFITFASASLFFKSIGNRLEGGQVVSLN